MKFLPRAFILLSAFWALASAAQDLPVEYGELARVEVSNPSTFERPDQALYLSFASLGLREGDRRAAALVAKAGSAVLPSQVLDHTGDGKMDTLLVLLDLAAQETRQLQISSAEENPVDFPARAYAEISHKTGGHWVGRKYVGGEWARVSELTPPESHTDHSEYIRYEGPGIESDKVGYRIYLDERNGFDIFGKRVSEPVLPRVGLDGFESYHHDADWGMDILKVGPSLGMGGYGYWQDGEVQRVSKVSGWTAGVPAAGPIHSALDIEYRDWEVAGKKVDLRSRLSMHAGSRLVKVRLHSSEPLDNLVAGLVKHPGTELITGALDITGRAYSYLATWGEQSLDGGKLGMAVVFQRRDLAQISEDEHNHAVVLRPRGTELEYYFLAAWDGEPDGIDSREALVAYLEQQVERLTLKPRLQLRSTLADALMQFPVSSEDALHWAQELVEAELQRHGTRLSWGGWDDMRERPAFWEYTTGLQMRAYDRLGVELEVDRYRQVAEEVISSFITADGNIHSYDRSKFNIDSINSGKMLLRLHQQTGEQRFRRAADKLREQLRDHPRLSNGAFWHKQRYPYQLWLDGVYMGMPFLAEYSLVYEEGASVKEAVHEFEVVRDTLRDPQTGLYWHALDEKKQQVWADPETGRSRYFWGRGMGWLAMALVDMLEIVPPGYEQERQLLADMTRQLASALMEFQHESGTWWQVMDMPQAPGNYLESSASSMFTYMLAKGVNLGVLSADYQDAAITAYEGLLREFIQPLPGGGASLTQICEVAGLGFGRDGSYRYYMSEPVIADDPKGMGPFVFASIEVARLLEKRDDTMIDGGNEQ